MDISKYQDIYQKIIQKVGDQIISVDERKAYKIYKEHNLAKSFPLRNIVYQDEAGASYSVEKSKELWLQTKSEIEAAKKGSVDATGEFNLFQLKYFNTSTLKFDIPMAEIAKNYFLCYKHNIDDFRKGLLSIDAVSTMNVYESLLKLIRDAVIEILVGELGTWGREKGTVSEYLKVLYENEIKLPDYNRKDDEIDYIDAYYNVSTHISYNFNKSPKQLFIDIVEKKFNDNPIIKKAICDYVEAQSDQFLKGQMTFAFNLYANNKQQRSVVQKELDSYDHLGLRSAIEDLLK